MTGRTAPVIRTRAITEADFGDVHAIAEASFQRLRGHATHLTPPELETVLTAPDADPLVDFPLVTVDGVTVAWGAFKARAPYSELTMGYVIHPDLDAGVAATVCSSLLRAFEASVAARVATLDADPARRAAVIVHERDEIMRDAVASFGFTYERQLLLMSIDQTVTPTSAPVWPDGVTVRPLTIDDAAVIGAVARDAFSEHPGDNGFSDEEVAHELSEHDVRLDVSLLATDDLGPVGTVLCFNPVGSGYVSVLGVLPRARGRGLGTALLRHAFQAFADDGLPLVRLHVEQDNATGALGVYESAGMRREYALQVWSRPA